MIIDEMKNIGKYAELSANFKAAVDFLSRTDLTALPLGKTVVAGDEVFAIKSESVLEREEPFWEAHEKYADVQVIVTGRERFGYGDAKLGEYDASADLYTCKDVNGFEFDRGVGQFVVFLPLEPHSPGNFVAKGETSVKVVVKVRAN